MNQVFFLAPATVLAFFLALLAGSTPLAAQLGDDDTPYDLRVKAILEELELKYEITEDGDFKLVLSVNEDRTHVVYVNSNTEFLDEMEVREVWAGGYGVDGPVPEEVANLLLRNSFDQKIGAWQVFGDEDFSLAMFAVKLSANANKETLRSAIAVVLNNADNVEMQLTGSKDEF